MVTSAMDTVVVGVADAGVANNSTVITKLVIKSDFIPFFMSNSSFFCSLAAQSCDQVCGQQPGAK